MVSFNSQMPASSVYPNTGDVGASLNAQSAVQANQQKSIKEKRAIRQVAVPLLQAQRNAIASKKPLSQETHQQVVDLTAIMGDVYEDKKAGSAKGKTNGQVKGEGATAVNVENDSSSMEALSAARKERLASIQTSLAGNDSIQKNDPNQATQRFMAQDAGFGKLKTGMQPTAQQLRAVATDPSATPLLPGTKTSIGNEQHYTGLLDRIKNSKVANMVSAARQKSQATPPQTGAGAGPTAGGALPTGAGVVTTAAAGVATGAAVTDSAQDTDTANFASTADAPQSVKDDKNSVIQANAKARATLGAQMETAAGGGDAGGLGFNWTAQAVRMGTMDALNEADAQQIEFQIQREENLVNALANETAIIMETANRQIDRLDPLMQFTRTIPDIMKAMSGGMAQKMSNTSPQSDMANLDFQNTLQSGAHNGGTTDMQMQQLNNTIVHGKGTDHDLPELRNAPDTTPELLEKLKKPYSGATKEAYGKPLQGVAAGSVEDHASLLMTEMYPGGPKIERVLQTPAETARLSEPNRKAYNDAHTHTRVIRNHDWYGAAGQVEMERRRLADASKRCDKIATVQREEANRIEKDKGPNNESNELRKKADEVSHYARVWEAKAEAFKPMHHGYLAQAAQARKNGDEKAAKDLEAQAAKYDPNASRIRTLLNIAERKVGPDEDRIGDLHRQLNYMADIAGTTKERLSKLSINVDSSGKPLPLDAHTQAEMKLLKLTGINTSMRQLGIGGLAKSYQNEARWHTRLSGFMQDPLEMSQIRKTRIDAKWFGKGSKGEPSLKEQHEAADRQFILHGTPIPEHLRRTKIELARVHGQYFAERNQPHPRDLGAANLNHVMISVYERDEHHNVDKEAVALLTARIINGLGGKVKEPAVTLDEHGEPNKQVKAVPSAAAIGKMLESTSRDRVLKHLDERFKALVTDSTRMDKLEAKLAQAKQSHGDTHEETQILQAALDRMQSEKENLRDMREMIRGIPTDKLTNSLWKGKADSALPGAFGRGMRQIRLAREKVTKDDGSQEPTSKKDIPAAAARADAFREDHSLWEARAPNRTDEEEIRQGNGTDVDFNDLDEAGAHLSGAAEGVTNIDGSLDLGGSTTGSYRNNTFERLTQAQNHASNLDLSALDQSEGDATSSNREVADGALGRVQESLQDEQGKIQAMWDRVRDAFQKGLPAKS